MIFIPTFGNLSFENTGIESAASLSNVGFIAYVGSSSAFYTSLYNVGSNNRIIYGDGYANHVIWRAGGIGLLRDPGNSNAMHFGQTGAYMSTLLAPGAQYDDAITQAINAYNATGLSTLLITQPGLNDIGRLDSVSSIQASIESVMAKCEAAGPAIRLAFTKAWPRLSTETNAASVLARRLEVNAMLETIVTQRGHGLIETEDVGDRGDGYVTSTWVDAVIPGHSAMPMASRISNIVYNWMSQNITWPSFNLIDHISSAANFNPGLSGTGGSGGRPTNWSTGTTGAVAPTFTWSLIPYGDGSSRQWIRIVTNANGGNGTVQLSETPTYITSGFSVGDRIDAMAQVRFPVEAGFAIGHVRIELFFGGSFAAPQGGTPRVTEQTPPIGMEWHNNILTLRAAPTLVPTGTTLIQAKVHISGSGTVDVGPVAIWINNNNLPPFYPPL